MCSYLRHTPLATVFVSSKSHIWPDTELAFISATVLPCLSSLLALIPTPKGGVQSEIEKNIYNPLNFWIPKMKILYFIASLNGHVDMALRFKVYMISQYDVDFQMSSYSKAEMSTKWIPVCIKRVGISIFRFIKLSLDSTNHKLFDDPALDLEHLNMMSIHLHPSYEQHFQQICQL